MDPPFGWNNPIERDFMMNHTEEYNRINTEVLTLGIRALFAEANLAFTAKDIYEDGFQASNLLALLPFLPGAASKVAKALLKPIPDLPEALTVVRNYRVYAVTQTAMTTCGHEYQFLRYIGITSNHIARMAAHLKRFGVLPRTIEALGLLSQYEARAIETYIILSFGRKVLGSGQLENIFLSLNRLRPGFNASMRWAEDFLRSSGVNLERWVKR